MPIKERLAAVIEKYRENWQFVGQSVTDVNHRGAMGDTMLHFATEAEALDDIEVLVANGANLNAAGDIGNTPLHSAALMGKTVAAKKLLELGADPTAKNEFGQTPADVARLGDRLKLAEILKTYKPRRLPGGGPNRRPQKP